MTDVFTRLNADCTALGARLFTITALDTAAGNVRRVHSSMPAEYAVSGTKPMTADGWHDHCITGRQTFVANTPPEFARYFFDHALIVSLGLGSCINIPVFDAAGPVLGTVNILAESGHFTLARLAAYQALVAAVAPDLCLALPAALQA
ncbi:MAG: GAF domain-containing protein [Paracoccaceae bacterium]